MSDTNYRLLIRNFLIELVLYGILVVAYFVLILRLLGDWLADLFGSNLAVYAFLSLGFVVVQAVFLDAVTTFLLDWLNLERLE